LRAASSGDLPTQPVFGGSRKPSREPKKMDLDRDGLPHAPLRIYPIGNWLKDCEQLRLGDRSHQIDRFAAPTMFWMYEPPCLQFGSDAPVPLGLKTLDLVRATMAEVQDEKGLQHTGEDARFTCPSGWTSVKVIVVLKHAGGDASNEFAELERRGVAEHDHFACAILVVDGEGGNVRIDVRIDSPDCIDATLKLLGERFSPERPIDAGAFEQRRNVV